MYVELALALLVMAIILALVVVLSEKFLFPVLDAREARKQAERARARLEESESDE